MASSFLLGITIYDTDGTTALSNVKVTARNENTNESLTANTDSNGQVIFNLANLSSGWTVGDKITYFVLYQGYEAYASFSITDTGGTTKTLTISAITISTLRYFTVQEFLNTFSLSSYDEDNQNGIKSITIVQAGQSIETEIDRLTNQTFDSNSGSYYTTTNEYYNADTAQRIFFLKNIPVNSITRFEVNENFSSESGDFHNIVYKQLDSCDAITGWSAGTDGSVSLNTTNDDFNEGTGCINLVKSGATQASVLFSKTITAVDFTNSIFKLDFYVEDPTVLASSGTAVQIRIGSDSSNYYSFNFLRGEVGDSGWSTLTLEYNSSSTNAGTTGTPTATACAYIAIQVTYLAAATTVSAPDMRIDNFRLNDEENLNIDYNTGRVEITEGSDYLPETGKDQVRVTYKYGISSVPYDIKRLAILMTARAFGSQMLQRLNITTSEAGGLGSALQNMRNYDDEIDRIIENRKMYVIENVWK